MNKGEVQIIVMQTIKELRRQGLLKDDYSAVLNEVEPVLRLYFDKRHNRSIEQFLYEYSADQYIDIIYLHYRDNIAMERIAEVMGKDVSTIKRNKKRLIMKMYEVLEV